MLTAEDPVCLAVSKYCVHNQTPKNIDDNNCMNLKVYCYLVFIFQATSWPRKTSTHCGYDNYGNYNTVFEAEEACTWDPNCAAIYDNNCDGNTVYLCPSNYTEQVSGVGSCLFVKPGNLFL